MLIPSSPLFQRGSNHFSREGLLSVEVSLSSESQRLSFTPHLSSPHSFQECRAVGQSVPAPRYLQPNSLWLLVCVEKQRHLRLCLRHTALLLASFTTLRHTGFCRWLRPSSGLSNGVALSCALQVTTLCFVFIRGFREV